MLAILQRALRARRAVKIIAGLNNFNPDNVVRVVRA
ncbi:MAG: DUF561 domain-containing protein, partial [Gemmatimonadaceae bacterium]|nr:DUF561 domain-containing protein [Gloeobacterales cyanobacterium ES-bin-141]